MNSDGPFQLRWRGQVSGPFTRAEVLQKLDEHEIGLWHELGCGGEWTTLGEFLEQEAPRAPARRPFAPAEDEPTVIGHRATVEPAPPPAAYEVEQSALSALPAAVVERPRRLRWFVLLGAALGFTGAHNFYAGYWGTAIAQVVLSLVTLALGFGFIVSWVWALIELLIVHTDARGVRLK